MEAAPGAFPALRSRTEVGEAAEADPAAFPHLGIVAGGLREFQSDSILFSCRREETPKGSGEEKKPPKFIIIGT